MPLDAQHPLYINFSPDWQLLRDSFAGERQVKEAGTTYLPATAGQVLDGMETNNKGYKRYQAYKQRAVFPSYVEEAVKKFIGVMHNKPPVIELPSQMEPLLERATLQGESLPLLLRRINEAQLLVGRFGLLLDLPKTGEPFPYIATYDAENIINWDDGKRDDPTLQKLNLVVLDESEYERDNDFIWEMQLKYRVLVLGDTEANESMGVYRQGLFRDETFDESLLIEPMIRGNTLDEIPFVFINTTDLLPEPLKPPLVGLANRCMTIYRGEADYRQSLHMQGQDTLVIIGGDAEIEYRTGADSVICPPTEGDAKYIGVDSSGLPEQRIALENDNKHASELAGNLIDATSRAKESGEALKIRVGAQTTTLHQIVLAGAEGLQNILRIAARWLGADPEKVLVTPNLDFTDDVITFTQLRDLQDAKQKGLPLSDQSTHELLQKNDLTSLTFKEEMAIIEAQKQMDMERQAKAFNTGMMLNDSTL